MKPLPDLEADRKDPAVKHIRLDPDHCDGCSKYSKCDLRLSGNAHKCRKGKK